MEKEQIKEEMLSLISKEIDQWLDTQSTIADGYEYEGKFMSVAQKINKIVLTQSIGKLPNNRNKKNSKLVLGK
jgi:hypothetical protein